jgi:hypothetical protein
VPARAGDRADSPVACHVVGPRTGRSSEATEDVGLFGPAGLALHGSEGAALCYLILGVTDPARWHAVDGDAMTRMAAQPPNHSPAFAPDPDALGVGITAMGSAAFACLHQDQKSRRPALVISHSPNVAHRAGLAPQTGQPTPPDTVGVSPSATDLSVSSTSSP